MAVTFTPAAARGGSRAGAFGPGSIIGIQHPILLATSYVVALAIALAYLGRFAALDRAETPASVLVNLNAVERAEQLEPGLAAAFPDASDRRAAAHEWFHALTAQRGSGSPAPSVGGAVRAKWPGHVAAIKPSFVVRTRAEFRGDVLLWAGLYLLGFHVIALFWRLRRIEGDYVLLAAAHLITGIGFAILLSRPDPLRDAPLFIRYTEGTLAGLGLMLVLSTIDFRRSVLRELSFVPLLGAIGLCALLIVFGGGPGHSGAKVNLGPVQPIEAIRLLLALFLAGYFARRWELLRGLRSRTIRSRTLPDWINVPRGEYALPVVAGVGVALLLFAVQRDLGPALLLCCVFLVVYAVARGRIAMPLIGFAVLLAGFYFGHLTHVSRTLSDRILMWRSPWDNSAAGGDQVAHALWAMATVGAVGTGIGLGDSRYLPAGHTDLILAAVGEELGVVGVMVLAAAYALIAWRGFRIARSASTDYGFFLALSLTLFVIVPTLVMAAGVFGVIPLTGVVTPFLSYGGSAMAANFAAFGILASIAGERCPAGDFKSFDLPVRLMSAAFVVAALSLLAVVMDIQVVRADDYAIRPHLGVQADGGRRYAYNPRVLDVARQLPRGTIYDRRGLPLATSDAAVLDRARPAYQKLGIALADVCPSPAERCYPLGGRAFHLLGDARNRTNWSASNTSYVERDAEAALRGFDEHATVVSTVDDGGRAMSTIRRDYHDVVPLLRHRYEPSHPAVAAMRDRSRDVRLTIDAGLQIRVAAIVESRARQAAGKAAAVVIDPDSGAVLASASYPWPTADAANAGGEDGDRDADPLLDRARYGLYPPGSTFKLVTAAAALARDVDLAKTTFECTRLSDGRVGAQLAGWSHPVRDDVLDAHAHGRIDMHDGLVHSCNAYFAQLALKLGAQPLVDCAAKLGIALTPPVTPGKTVARVRETLPQVGYGQADVRATPLRMARVAAAIAASGVLRDTHWDQAAPPNASPWLTPGAARLLAGDLRDVVTGGTAASLRNHPWRIAGKTGTAEVNGAASHAWFVGYAPYGAAKKRIAFAVIVEHGGYGGRTAAPAAGEIVTAAGLSGLLE